eukprot:7027760-Prorocentrum_lima.AAC.1
MIAQTMRTCRADNWGTPDEEPAHERVMATTPAAAGLPYHHSTSYAHPDTQMTIQCIHPGPGSLNHQGMHAQAGMQHQDWIGATGRSATGMRWELPADAGDEDVYTFHLEQGEQA